jgi:hypothetical protein
MLTNRGSRKSRNDGFSGLPTKKKLYHPSYSNIYDPDTLQMNPDTRKRLIRHHHPNYTRKRKNYDPKTAGCLPYLALMLFSLAMNITIYKNLNSKSNLLTLKLKKTNSDILLIKNKLNSTIEKNLLMEKEQAKTNVETTHHKKELTGDMFQLKKSFAQILNIQRLILKTKISKPKARESSVNTNTQKVHPKQQKQANLLKPHQTTKNQPQLLIKINTLPHFTIKPIFTFLMLILTLMITRKFVHNFEAQPNDPENQKNDNEFAGDNPIRKKKPSRIKLNFWNVRYFNANNPAIRVAKRETLRRRDPDVIIINEAYWNPSINNYTTYAKFCSRNTARPKCNTAILIKNNLEHQLQHTIDENLMYVKIPTTLGYIHVLAFYGSQDSKTKKLSMNSLRMTIDKICSSETNPKIILCGDFNIEIKKGAKTKDKDMKHLLKVLRFNHLSNWTCKRRTANNEISKKVIDHCLSNNLYISSKVLPNSEKLSDHKGFTISFKTCNLTKRISKKFPNKETATKIMKEILQADRPNLQTYNSAFQKHKNSTGYYLKTKSTFNKNLFKILEDADNIQEIRDKMSKDFEKTIKSIERLRFSRRSKTAFQMMDRLSSKRNKTNIGSPFINQLNMDGVIINNQDQIDELIVNDFKKKHTESKPQTLPEEPSFPKMNEPSTKEIKMMSKAFCKNKALTFDGITDLMFNLHARCYRRTITCTECRKKIIFMKSVWSKDFWSSNSSNKNLISRLLPMNKKRGQIPTLKSYRPLIIASPLLKFLESRLKSKLKDFCNSKLEKSQTGFLDKCSTQINLTLLFNMLYEIRRNRRNRKQVWLLFIDFRSAYDNVRRPILYNRINELKILTKQETDLMRFIHFNLEIGINKSRTRTQLGVPQGSPISPLLFNIFLDDLLRTTGQNKSEEFQQFGFADDLLFASTDLCEIERTIDEITEWCSKTGMALNKSKSGILTIFPKKPNDENPQPIDHIKEIPLVEKYKYLGIVIDKNASLNLHMNDLKKKVGFIRHRYSFIFSKNSIRFRRNAFQVFIAPLFTQLCGAFIYLRSQDKTKLLKLWKGAFKKFMGLKNKTGDKIIKYLLPFNFTNYSICVFRKTQSLLDQKFNKKISEDPFEKQKILRTHERTPTKKIKIALNHIPNITRLINKIGTKTINMGYGPSMNDLETIIGLPIVKILEISLNPTINTHYADQIKFISGYSAERLITEAQRIRNLPRNQLMNQPTPPTQTAIHHINQFNPQPPTRGPQN